jgi:hypothetical protein
LAGTILIEININNIYTNFYYKILLLAAKKSDAMLSKLRFLGENYQLH